MTIDKSQMTLEEKDEPAWKYERSITVRVWNLHHEDVTPDKVPYKSTENFNGYRGLHNITYSYNVNVKDIIGEYMKTFIAAENNDTEFIKNFYMKCQEVSDQTYFSNYAKHKSPDVEGYKYRRIEFVNTALLIGPENTLNPELLSKEQEVEYEWFKAANKVKRGTGTRNSDPDMQRVLLLFGDALYRAVEHDKYDDLNGLTSMMVRRAQHNTLGE